jgi:hypothetical protein
VIGVNAAYLEDFQGGNYGVPVNVGKRLLAGGARRPRMPGRSPNTTWRFIKPTMRKI